MNEEFKPEKTPVGVEAQCWACSKIWNITLLPVDSKDVKCTCGGYVVTPSGKAMTRPFYDAFDSMAPLLEENTYTDSIAQKILGSDKPTRKIILP